jgi:hypothetical protein
MPITFQNVTITGGLQLVSAGVAPPSGDPDWANVSLLMNTTSNNNQTNDTFLDSSTNNFTITGAGKPAQGTFTPFTLAPSTSYSTSVNGGSGYFNGSGDRLTTPITGQPAFAFGTGDFTIEFWAYRTGAGGGDRHIIDANNGANYLIRWNAAGNLQFFANASLVVSYAFPFSLSTWYHVAVVRNGSTCTMYVNGTSVASNTNTSNIAASGTLFIGGQPAASDWYQGYMSSVRLVKGTAVYTGNFTPSTTPLTAISGTSFLLNFTNGNIFDGTTKNNLNTLGDAKVSTTQSKFAPTSVVFDGTGDYLTAPSNTAFAYGTGDFTWEAWVYMNTTSGNQYILDHGLESGTLTYNGGLRYYNPTTGIGSALYTTAPTLTAGTWNHIAVARQSGTTRLFLNGTLVASGADSNNFASAAISIAQYGGGGLYYNGYIQDLRLTKGVARYTANFTPPTAPFPTN